MENNSKREEHLKRVAKETKMIKEREQKLIEEIRLEEELKVKILNEQFEKEKKENLLKLVVDRKKKENQS